MPRELPGGIITGVYPAEAHALAWLARRQRVIEFGTWIGFSTIVMARVAEQVVTVDWHHGDIHAGERETLVPYLDNLARFELRDTVITIIGRFEQVAPFLNPGRFTFGFLDGTHDYASTYRDLTLMASLLDSPGCRMAVHDYDRSLGDEPFEVTPALEDWRLVYPEWRKVRLVQSLYVMERA